MAKKSDDGSTRPDAEINKQTEATEKLTKAQQAQLDIQKLQLQTAREIAKTYGDSIGKEERTLLVQKQLHDTAKLRLEIAEDELKVLEKQGLKFSDEANQLREMIWLLAEKAEETKKAADEAERFADALDAAKGDSGRVLESFFGINAEATKTGKALKNFPEYAKRLGKELKEGLSYTNLMGAAANKAKEAFQSMGKAVSERYGLSKPKEIAMRYYDESRKIASQANVLTTDELATFQKRTSAIAANTRFTREEIEKTYESLFKASAAFRQASPKDQDTIRTLGMTLERRLGVPAAASTKAIEELTLAFGKTQPEAQKLTANFALLGKELKIGPAKLMADFGANASALAKFGLPKVTERFARLAEVQAKSGVAMGTLITGMEQWSTFEGALTAASNLNAVFGSTIDAMEVMDAYNSKDGGPLKAFMLIREGVEATGESIETMALPRLRALGKGYGFGAQEMLKLASVSTSTLDAIANKPANRLLSLSDVMAKVKKEEEDMEGLSQSGAKMQDQQAKSMEDLVAIWIEGQKEADKMAKSLGAFAPIIASATGALISLGGQFATFAMMSTMMSGPGGQLTAMAKGFKMLGKTALFAAGAMLAVQTNEMKKSGAEKWKTAGMGAASGAMMGSAILPGWGTAIGAIGGGIYGMFDGGQEVVSQDGLKYVHAGEKIVSQNTVNRELAKTGNMNFQLTANFESKDGKTLATAQANFADFAADHMNSVAVKVSEIISIT